MLVAPVLLCSFVLYSIFTVHETVMVSGVMR